MRKQIGGKLTEEQWEQDGLIQKFIRHFRWKGIASVWAGGFFALFAAYFFLDGINNSQSSATAIYITYFLVFVFQSYALGKSFWWIENEVVLIFLIIFCSLFGIFSFYLVSIIVLMNVHLALGGTI